MREPPEYRQLLTASEVAAMFSVHRDSVGRWSDRGLLTAVRTPGGRRRYYADEVAALLASSQVHTYRGNGERE